MTAPISKMDIYWKEDLLCTVSWGDNRHLVKVKNYTGKKNIFVPYVMKDEFEYSITINDLDKFLETRCVPRTREGIDDLLKRKYNLKYYSTFGICEQTHGVSISDFLWVKFNDESICYDDVKLR